MTGIPWWQCQWSRWQYRRGLTCLRQGVYAQALSLFQAALVHHPRPAAVYLSLGRLHLEAGDSVAAITAYTQALHLTPTSATAYGHRGLAHVQRGDVDAALADWEQALHHQPAYPEVYYSRGLIHAQQGDGDTALADFNQAIALNPNLLLAYYHRGLLHHGQGRKAAAAADWRMVLSNDPGFVPAGRRLQALYQELRQDTLARALENALTDYGLRVTTELGGDPWVIHLERPAHQPVAYPHLVPLLRPCLHQVPGQLARRFQVIGHVDYRPDPEWYGTFSMEDAPLCPPSHWRPALLATLVFPPFGIPALLYAYRVQELHHQEHFAAARLTSRTARALALLGMAISGLVGASLLVGLAFQWADPTRPAWQSRPPSSTLPYRRGLPPSSPKL